MLVSVSFTRLCRGITISFIFEQPLEFYVDKLIIHVQFQRSVNCRWYTSRYGSGQGSRQTKQVTGVQRRRSWESTSLHKALWWGMSLTVLAYGSLPKQYIAPNTSHISSASGTKEFLGTQWEYYVRNTSLWVMCQESPLSTLEWSQRHRILHVKDCDKCELVKWRKLDMFQLLVFVTKPYSSGFGLCLCHQVKL